MTGFISLTLADNKTAVDPSHPLPTGTPNPDNTVGPQAYTLFKQQTTNASGNQVGPVGSGSYLFTADGTFGGGTVKLQVLQLDGVTWRDLTGVSLTAAGSVGVVLGQGAIVRAVLSGSTAASLYANLS